MKPQLRDYQKKGVEFLLSQPYGLPHALLADAPGTGKTAMSIEAAKLAGCRNGIILVPATIKEQWRREMIRWELDGEDAIQIVYGRDAVIDNRPWVIVNYELIREKEIHRQLFERQWHLLVEDEAHRLKTHKSQQSKAVFARKTGLGHSCYWKWPMSGSIMPNRTAELFPILFTHFPQVLQANAARGWPDVSTWEKYGDRYCGGPWVQYKGATHVDELTDRLQSIMLRRELEDVWDECPDVIENEVWLDVPFEQHPEWLGEGFMNEESQRRVIAEAKMPQVAAYVRQRLEDRLGKIVVITYHRGMTEGLERELAEYKPLKIYGGISPKQREISLAKFREDPQYRVFLLQIQSAGEGVDGLQHVCAEYVYAQPEWSYGREDQAGRRIYRLGQPSNIVLETKLIAARSFEEVIHYANLRKRSIIDVVLKPNGGSFVMGVFESLEARVAALEAKLGQAPQAAAPQAPAPQVPNLQLVPPAPALAALTPMAPAPVAAPLPIPAPPAALPALPAAAATVPPPPAVSAAPAANFGGFPTRKAFEDYVVDRFKAYAAAGATDGVPKFQALLGTFGATKMGDVADAHLELFLQHLAATIPAA